MAIDRKTLTLLTPSWQECCPPACVHLNRFGSILVPRLISECDLVPETRITIVEDREVCASYVVRYKTLLIAPLLPESPLFCRSFIMSQFVENFIKQVLWSSGYDSRLGCHTIGCERSPVRVRARPCFFCSVQMCCVYIFGVVVSMGKAREM